MAEEQSARRVIEHLLRQEAMNILRCVGNKDYAAFLAKSKLFYHSAGVSMNDGDTRRIVDETMEKFAKAIETVEL